MKLKSRLQYLMYFDSKTLLKYFGLFLILGFGAINLTHGYNYIEHCNCYGGDLNYCETYNYDFYPCREFDPGEYVSIKNNVNTVSREFQFTNWSDDYYKAFSLQGIIGSYGNVKNYTLFWTNNKGLKLVYDGNARVSLYSINYVCRYQGTDIKGAFDYCGYEECGNNQTINVNSFINAVENLRPSKMYFMYNGPSQGQPIGNLCAVYGNVTYCIRMGGSDEWGNLCSYATLDQENITSVGNGFDYYKTFFMNSPFYDDPNSNLSDIPNYTDLNPHSNSSVYNMYAEKGYTRGLCYSDRGIDNLATSTGGFEQFYGGDLDDGVYFSGATIFDLYNYNSGGRTLIEWLDFWNTNYQNSVSRNNPVNYYNKPKGLWYWFYKYNTIYKRNIGDSLNYTDMYNYCSYFLNYDSSTQGNNNYNGPTLPEGVDSRTPLDYLLNPPEGSILDKFRNGEYGTGGSGSGSNSGSGSSNGSGSVEEDMQGTFDSWFETTSNLINLDSVESVVGILPRYIVVAFVGSLVFYVLRK